ncbi:hypothetical protein L6164_001998 [Bauhinia variegata]|uniref:Uncharacterized protein n=1 Tax=Bauhinia variegata TaxID=167791 RepID=A0ACB9PWB7_BAUVA|nr:hypothetical protein L6164_001998 [Bauhinia variegata]
MAAEGIAADVAANIIATLIKKAVSQAQYLFCFNNIIGTLEKQEEERIKKQERTEERAEWAHRRTERIDVEVQKWLKDAEKWDVGRDIARECNELPVAIAAVAGSLKGKEFIEWGEACAMLRDSGQVDVEPEEVGCLVDMTNSFYQIGTVFSKLTHLEISSAFYWYCRQLEYLMPISFAKGLLQLENVEIKGAPQLKYVFGQSNPDDEDLLCNQTQSELYIIKLPSLKSLKLESLPNILSIFPENYCPILPYLDSVKLSDCPKLKILLDHLEFRHQDHNIRKLEYLHIGIASQLKYVFGKSNHEAEDLFHNWNQLHIIKLQALKRLQFLANIISIYPDNYHPIRPSLDSMELKDCPKLNIFLEKIEFREASHTITKNGIVFCNLTKLEFYGLNCLDTLAYEEWKIGNRCKIDWDTYSEIRAILAELIAMAPLSNDLEQEKPLPGPLVLPQNPSPQSIKGSIEEIPNLDDANLVITTLSIATSSESGLLQGQTKTYINEDVKVEPIINLQPFEGTNLVEFHSMEEEEDVPASIPSSLISVNNPDMDANSVAKALADLQVTLKMPLENIASSEAESIRLENTLNFLSSHSCADGAMSDGLKSAIESLREDLHSILSSFKQASATIVRFTLLEEKEKSIKDELPRRRNQPLLI